MLALFQNFLTADAIFKVNVRREDEVEIQMGPPLGLKVEMRSTVVSSGKTPCGQEVKPTFLTFHVQLKLRWLDSFGVVQMA
jgi:hypothetical protein